MAYDIFKNPNTRVLTDMLSIISTESITPARYIVDISDVKSVEVKEYDSYVLTESARYSGSVKEGVYTCTYVTMDNGDCLVVAETPDQISRGELHGTITPKYDYKLVQYGASWCGPCKALKPLVEAACAKHDIRFEYVDIDTPEGVALALGAGVRSVPKLFIVNLITRESIEVGARTASELDKSLRVLKGLSAFVTGEKV